jgi:hypothetical protein
MSAMLTGHATVNRSGTDWALRSQVLAMRMRGLEPPRGSRATGRRSDRRGVKWLPSTFSARVVGRTAWSSRRVLGRLRTDCAHVRPRAGPAYGQRGIFTKPEMMRLPGTTLIAKSRHGSTFSQFCYAGLSRVSEACPLDIGS